jgi:hypothetical protein
LEGGGLVSIAVRRAIDTCAIFSITEAENEINDCEVLILSPCWTCSVPPFLKTIENDPSTALEGFRVIRTLEESDVCWKFPETNLKSCASIEILNNQDHGIQF